MSFVELGALSTIEDVARHGANVFVMGSAFFKAKDPKRFCEQIRSKLASLSPSVRSGS